MSGLQKILDSSFIRFKTWLMHCIWRLEYSGNATVVNNQQSTADFFFINGRLMFKRIIMNKSTEEFSGIPYVMTLLNCLLATWGWCFAFLNNTENGDQNKECGVHAILFVVVRFPMRYFLVYLWFTRKGQFVAVSIFPESNLENFVPQSRSGLIDVETCPNSFRLIEFLKTVVQVPNGFGSGLGAIQLILYAVYCKNKGEKMKTTADGSLEKGLVSNGNPYQESISSKYPPQGHVETRV
ncbi:hypothetical protein RJ639_022123 [Escallonia herrerae]|uniref:Bidirectional sugar transporter SWEET n=1 Tax=Escallonia herrerae TaxID=1293975 RepID=A0AA88V605_9ASTE|nr:hypothetical protein RJ639_022123 [Escallonia herrerae]